MSGSVKFGSCRLDVGQRQLVREGKEVHVSPKAFDLLLHLIDRRPDVVSKGQLLEAIWPGIFVAEVNLSVLVAELRAAVGDAAREPRIIRTHHGIGYSFVASVSEVEREVRSTGPSCMLSAGGVRFHLVQGTSIVGRDAFCEVHLPDPSVSRRHARIEVEGTVVTLEDLKSKNGTRVNRAPIDRPVVVRDGQLLTFGSMDVALSIVGGSGASTDTALSVPVPPSEPPLR